MAERVEPERVLNLATAAMQMLAERVSGVSFAEWQASPGVDAEDVARLMEIAESMLDSDAAVEAIEEWIAANGGDGRPTGKVPHPTDLRLEAFLERERA